MTYERTCNVGFGVPGRSQLSWKTHNMPIHDAKGYAGCKQETMWNQNKKSGLSHSCPPCTDPEEPSF